MRVERGDGVTTITVGRGLVLEGPLFLDVIVPEGTLVNQRTTIVLEEGAEAGGVGAVPVRR